MTRLVPAKLLSRSELITALSHHRLAGKSVAFANGLFDILHVGHLRYLTAASKEADLLVVGVNSDASARKLKGPERPFVPASERAELICGFACVDYVTIFEEEKAAPLILAIKPDVQCKGTDYTTESIPEREAVESYGGRVAIVGDPKDHATTDIIKKISAAPGGDR
jgi:rfaE bifunctional protein nucleotidyltransferase chain/domain